MSWRGALAGAVGAATAGPLRLLPAKIRLDVRSRLRMRIPLDYARGRILLDVESEIERATRGRSCSKEPKTIEWIEEDMRPGDVFYDVGANVGAYSLVAAVRWRGDVRVFAFEPAFANYAKLCANILLNDVGGIVTPFPLALSDATGLARFHFAGMEPGSALHGIGGTHALGGPSRGELAVGRISLDDAISRFDLPPPTHLKIDTDGHDEQVLLGAASTIERRTLRSVLVEIEPGASGEAVHKRLVGAGFQLIGKHAYTLGGTHSSFAGSMNAIYARGRGNAP